MADKEVEGGGRGRAGGVGQRRDTESDGCQRRGGGVCKARILDFGIWGWPVCVRQD